jgi:hypothetical protein
VQFLFIFFVVLVTSFLNNLQNSQSSAFRGFATLAMVPFLLFMMWFPKNRRQIQASTLHVIATFKVKQHAIDVPMICFNILDSLIKSPNVNLSN